MAQLRRGTPDLAHQTDERVHVDLLLEAARFFAELPFELFEGGSRGHH
jgi:acetylornithine deacetylase/succinyl-diaminopimelate desuccinylase-like protein